MVSSSPSKGETVTDPIQTVSMTFSDDLLDFAGMTAQMTVTDDNDGHHESGCVTIDGSSVSTDVALGEAGEYTVDWSVVSSDGHATSGRYTFDWQPSMPTATTSAMTSSPVCGAAWSGSAQPTEQGLDSETPSAAAVDPGTAPLSSLPEPTMTILNASPVGQTDTSGLTVPLLVAGLVALLAALSAVFVIVMRRVRRS